MNTAGGTQDADVATHRDVWMIPAGEYVIRIGLYRTQGDRLDPIRVSTAEIQVQSKLESRYYFKQYLDLARRVKKLQRAVSRLFPRESE